MPAALAIHRVNARLPADAQPVAARLALQALGADLAEALPSGLPPQSLLWLRRLQLQAPAGALRRVAPWGLRQDWIAAGRQQLDAALAAAARPALGAVPADAWAVLFADEAEMLACLALAARRGQLDRWWWRGLLGRHWPEWQRAWAERPQAQAGARRLLAAAGAAGAMPEPASPPAAVPAHGPLRDRRFGEVIAAATPRQGATAQRAAPHAGVPAAAVATPASWLSLAARPAGAAPREGAPLADASALFPASGHRPAPEPADPPPVRRAVSPAGPVTAASGGLGSGLRARGAGASTSPSPAQRTAMDLHTALPAAPGRRPGAMPAGPPGPDVLSQHDRMAPPAAPAVVQPAAERSRSLARPGGPAPVARDASAPPVRPPHAAAGDASRPAPPSDAASDATWPSPQRLATRLAPLLFVANALLEDGLYPDFTRPRDAGLPVPLGLLLAALAQAWRLPADPLPAALAALAQPGPVPAAMPAVPGVPAQPWPGWLAAYARLLRRRLCRRLGLRHADWPRALVLARPATLWWSTADWVVTFDLAAHDLAWRLAGLDRDPGWLPTAGIRLRFTFR